ncbi:phosphonate metabolism protein/1,5-bisphosphokinase (PRPP-forming) PhnN [Methylobacterium nodulans]|uniref:Ribose 1,5-bisphosphate phosphokinase PhnN n=1 Tax=Methylobacterium nodulans (strain LMG 21967 / CNCM I-2342 / ORS 2060) TaxID=460265 RepID=B8IV32_METNO|nr:phosphonate metabolism protein/1,5-bisphosphokinase (PRPP-forming) PhnN [Methylobacterium nodulans]ACL59090.1 phosphonate metabolism protein/1,5-bisphosphokinase (PRPP-forming) PhnN [Methylobacterium nodulans ORS 2060]
MRPGGFVLVVGPSGAGKDTLIRLARAALADEPRFVFPRRLVTRPPSAHEDNDEIGEAAFAEGEASGRFALSWHAHGLGYALPRETVALAQAGQVVVVNISRRIVAEARARLPRVSVVAVTAPPAVLAARLAVRGRPEDGDIAARLARQAPDEADLTIVNDGPPEDGAARLVAHLRAR